MISGSSAEDVNAVCFMTPPPGRSDIFLQHFLDGLPEEVGFLGRKVPDLFEKHLAQGRGKAQR
jgi:hypothetical protein